MDVNRENQKDLPEPKSMLRRIPFKKIAYRVLVILILAAVAYSVYRFVKGNNRLADIVPDRVVTLFGGAGEKEWQTYTNDLYAYSIKYPEEVELSEQPDGSIFLIQESSGNGSGGEFTDGISVEIAMGKLNERPLQSLVEDVIEEIENTPSLEIEQDPEIFNIGSRAGYKFVVAGINRFIYMYVPVGMDSYLEIVDATQDPESKGYRSDAERIVSSMEFLPPPPGL